MEIDMFVLDIFEVEIVSKFRFVRLIEVPSTRSHKSRKIISDLMNSSDLMFVFVVVVVVTLPLPRSDRKETNRSDRIEPNPSELVSHIAFKMNISDLISDL